MLAVEKTIKTGNFLIVIVLVVVVALGPLVVKKVSE